MKRWRRWREEGNAKRKKRHGGRVRGKMREKTKTTERKPENEIIYDASRFPPTRFSRFRENFQQADLSSLRRDTTAHGSSRQPEERKSTKEPQTSIPRGGGGGRRRGRERKKRLADERRRDEPKETRESSAECLFEFLGQVAISSERRSFEPARVKRNHTDLHIMIYILVLCLLFSLSLSFSLSLRRPRLASVSLDHAPPTLDSSSLSLCLVLSSFLSPVPLLSLLPLLSYTYFLIFHTLENVRSLFLAGIARKIW